MKLTLQVVDTNGNVILTPINQSGSIAASADHRYRLFDESDAEATDIAPRVLRIDDDLIVEGLPNEQRLTLSDFFTNCESSEYCKLDIDLPGIEPATITPASEPLAAYADGGFLMYASGQTQQAILPVAPEAEASFSWRPIAALGGALSIAAAGAGGGGGDQDAPGNPTIVSGTHTNSRTPVLTGKAEAGSDITLTIAIDGSNDRLTYNTRTDSNGDWSIDLANDTPSSGSLPAQGLPVTGAIQIHVIATDQAGNSSEVSNETITLDVTPPSAPILANDGDLNSPATAAPTLNASQIQAGTVLHGTAEAGSTVTLTISDGASFSQELTTQTDSAGEFSVNLTSSDLPSADGQISVLVRATDAAGNDSPDSISTITLDRQLSDAAISIDRVVDNRAPGIGFVDNGGTTNDTTPGLLGTVSSPLNPDEFIMVFRDGDAIGQGNIHADGSWSFLDNGGVSDGQHTYTARVMDGAGNSGNRGILGEDAGGNTIVVQSGAGNTSQSLSISNVLDNDSNPERSIANDGETSDSTPLIQLTLGDVLATGQVLQLYRSTFGTDENNDGTVLVGELASNQIEGTTAGFQDERSEVDSLLTYEARIVEANGQVTLTSQSYRIEIVDSDDLALQALNNVI